MFSSEEQYKQITFASFLFVWSTMWYQRQLKLSSSTCAISTNLLKQQKHNVACSVWVNRCSILADDQNMTTNLFTQNPGS